MQDKSLPEDGVQSSSDLRNEESLLDQDSQQSADEQQQDTDSGDKSSQDSGSDSSQDSAQQDESTSSDDDKALENFAKSRGYDFTDLTEREKKLLRDSYENQKAYRKANDKKAEELRKSVDDLNSQQGEDESDDAYERRISAQERRLAQLEARDSVRSFYQDNPEAKDYDTEMAKVLQQEKEQFGVESARLLARNLPRLLREAKALRGDNGADVAREAGRREERESLRRRQEGSADTAHATTSTTPSKKIDKAWVDNEYDPTNPEHVKLLDEALVRGDLY